LTLRAVNVTTKADGDHQKLGSRGFIVAGIKPII